MAARQQAARMELVPLRRLKAEALERLFEEEKARWLSLLHWDFTASAELVTRYVEMRALDGCVLMDGGEIAGYCYWVPEEHKGLIGDLYVRDAWRSPANENLLLEAGLEEFRSSPWIRRVEAQLMQLTLRGSQVAPAYPPVRSHARHFMLARIEGIGRLRGVRVDDEFIIGQWSTKWLEESAELIAEVYAGHVDSEINDQYHSANGAKRFLQNVVQYPGCGRFSPNCSFVALNRYGQVRGMSLASMVAGDVGHITQICVAGEHHGKGLGYELLRRSLASFEREGAREASLTVTAANRQAVRLYDRIGFRVIHTFEALVWEKRRGPVE